MKSRNEKIGARRASTLMLSLLVLSAMLIVGASIGSLAITETALTKNNDETIVATYAAESGLEQGAFRTRISGDALSSLAGSKALANNASWNRTASDTQGLLVFRNIPKNLTRGFDFYNADTSGAGGKESVKITIASCDGSEWLDLGWVPFNPGGAYPNQIISFQKARYHCTAGTNSVIYNNNISSSYAYRFYIRYIQGNSAKLGQISISGCASDNGGLPCDMPGVINLTSTGTYRGASRKMNLVLPRLAPVTGIFDYGVFSECQIIKDPTNPNPAC